MEKLTPKQRDALLERLAVFEEMGYYAGEILFGVRDWLEENTEELKCICNLDPEDTNPVKIFNPDCDIHGFEEGKE